MSDNELENRPAPPPASEPSKEAWERSLVQRLVFAANNEQRRARRWGIFFKSLGFIYLFALLWIYLPKETTGITTGKHTALVDLQGVIADNAEANADTINAGLRAAFKDKNTAGVILRINSPGGSPVQAGYINDEIRRLRVKYPNIPLYAVITDICASGGYYVAAAADRIYADKASLVGSIGVLADGFGFVGTMEKLGVERRLLTAGEHKGFLDPFSPVNEDEVKHMKELLGDVHKQFIETVKKGRGDRLKEGADLYNGFIWTGEQGVDLGLVDGLGSSSSVARDIIKAENIVDFTVRGRYLDRLVERLGMSAMQSLSAVLGLQERTPSLR
jgi:protease-4